MPVACRWPRAARATTITSNAYSTPARGASSCRWSTPSSKPSAIIAAAKYPPQGNRSLGGGMHGLNFDSTAGEYFKLRPTMKFSSSCKPKAPQGVRKRRSDLQPARRGRDFRRPCGSAGQMRATRRHERQRPSSKLCKSHRRRQKNRHPHRHARDERRSGSLARTAGMQFIAVASELRMMTAKAEEFLKTLKPKAQAKDVARYCECNRFIIAPRQCHAPPRTIRLATFSSCPCTKQSSEKPCTAPSHGQFMGMPPNCPLTGLRFLTVAAPNALPSRAR